MPAPTLNAERLPAESASRDLLQEYWDAEFAAAYQRARAAVDGFFEYLSNGHGEGQ